MGNVFNRIEETFFNLEDLFCKDLPTDPKSSTGKILVTGTTGYVGGRLVPELLARGYKLRIMVRRDSPELKDRWPDVEIVTADALDQNQLIYALQDITVAYYLIHSLLLGKKKFEIADIAAAINFRKAAEQNNIKRIIYLGGLGVIHPKLSKHLTSRIQVANELSSGKVPATILRAGIIIGSGSASFEIIKNLVKKSIIYIIPSWAAKNKCQPISIRDVIKYLIGVLEIENTVGKNFDIGGEDVLTYEELLKIFAGILGQRRLFLRSFLSDVRLYSYFVSLFTPVPMQIVSGLMEGGRNEVICHDCSIVEYLSFKPLSYKESVIRALSREDHDRIYTRWSDSYPPAHEFAIKLSELPVPAHYKSSYSLLTNKGATFLFQSICSIGGKEGWFHSNWMWRLRGVVDRLLTGVGTSRGRRSSSRLRINDVIDFWRVEDLIDDERLLLRAEMKLPGKAWLELRVRQVQEKNELSVHGYFDPHGFIGKIYWYVFLPFHRYIFNDLIVELDKMS